MVITILCTLYPASAGVLALRHEGFLLRAAPLVLPSAASADKGEEHLSLEKLC